MSAPTSLLQQPNQVQMRATSCKGRPQEERAAAHKQNDLIETKFNQLARKILAELQPNSARAHQFFLALDSILQEPQHGQEGPSSGRLSRSSSRKQLAEQQQDLTRKCDILLAKQKMQQDQLDSHQQILFDKQYESLPAEITRARSQVKVASNQRPLRGGVRKTATTSKLAERKAEMEAQIRSGARASEKASGPGGHSKRSAIPTSTVLAGINQLSKSATTGSFGASSERAAQFSRQSSLRVKTAQQEERGQLAVVPAREPETSRKQPTASEKLKQRRPTKAQLSADTDEDDDEDDDEDEDDDDDDDDSYEYQNLASRRAHLNQRFIRPAGVAGGQPVVKSNTFTELKTTEAANRLAPPEQQRQRQVSNLGVKSQTSTSGLQTRQPGSAEEEEEEEEDEEDDNFDDQSEGPRSISGLLASQSGNMMYKPHMNYSQSLLGNHRLSDDDEIIIIPTAHSPTPSLLMSASPSPIGGRASQQQRPPCSQANDQEPGGNLDEFNERFSISRTKSFWEKLAGSKKIVSVADSVNQNKQQQQQSDANNNKPIQQHLPSGPHKSAFERLDSTGGSGNSHHSGCSSNSSSSSGDEQAAAAAAYASRHLNPSLGHQKQSASIARSNSRQQSTWTAPNPTVKQLVQQQIQRSDRFRQTR